jgi:hypothetical protein
MPGSRPIAAMSRQRGPRTSNRRVGKRRSCAGPTVRDVGGHAEPVIGRAFARPVGFAHPTPDMISRSRGANASELLQEILAPNKGSGECRVPVAPAAACVR